MAEFIPVATEMPTLEDDPVVFVDMPPGCTPEIEFVQTGLLKAGVRTSREFFRQLRSDVLDAFLEAAICDAKSLSLDAALPRINLKDNTFKSTVEMIGVFHWLLEPVSVYEPEFRSYFVSKGITSTEMNDCDQVHRLLELLNAWAMLKSPLARQLKTFLAHMSMGSPAAVQLGSLYDLPEIRVRGIVHAMVHPTLKNNPQLMHDHPLPEFACKKIGLTPMQALTHLQPLFVRLSKAMDQRYDDDTIPLRDLYHLLYGSEDTPYTITCNSQSEHVHNWPGGRPPCKHCKEMRDERRAGPVFGPLGERKPDPWCECGMCTVPADGGGGEDGLKPDEINLVMSQIGCPRACAIHALRHHGNIVDAILALTP